MAGPSMSSAAAVDCYWLRGGQQVDDRAYRGKYCGCQRSGDGGGRSAAFGGGHPGEIRVEVTKLSPACL